MLAMGYFIFYIMNQVYEHITHTEACEIVNHCLEKAQHIGETLAPTSKFDKDSFVMGLFIQNIIFEMTQLRRYNDERARKNNNLARGKPYESEIDKSK